MFPIRFEPYSLFDPDSPLMNHYSFCSTLITLLSRLSCGFSPFLFPFLFLFWVVSDDDVLYVLEKRIDVGRWSAGLDLVAYVRHEVLKGGCVVVALGLVQMLGAGFCLRRLFCSVKYPPMAMVRFPSFVHPIPPPPSPPLTTRASVPPPLASTS